jgi:hypothetical protein
MAERKSVMREAARMVHTHDDSMMKVEFDYLNKRDDDLSVKAGAVLGFAGLLIAATLVLLAAEPQTALHAEAASLGGLVAAVSLAALFPGAVLSLLAIAMSRVYDLSDASMMMMRLDRRFRSREALWRFACTLTFLGALAMAAAYGLVLAANAFGMRIEPLVQR